MHVTLERVVRKTCDLPAGLALMYEPLAEVRITIASYEQQSFASREYFLVDEATGLVASRPQKLADIYELFLGFGHIKINSGMLGHPSTFTNRH